MIIDNDTGSIQMDDQSSYTENDAADALMKGWGIEDEEEETPAEPDTTDLEADEDSPPDEDQGDETDDEPSEEDGEDDAEEGTTESRAASDNDTVTLKVDGQDVSVKVSDLKRLYGQEASLTRKSQEVATQRKSAEQQQQRHATALDALVKKAETRWDKYKHIDFNLAAQQLDTDSYTALKAEAEEAYNDFTFVGQELDTFIEGARQNQHASMVEQAKASVEVLQESIPDWNEQTYGKIRTYAIDSGLEVETVNQIIHPSAVQMIYKAMMYDAAKKVATTKKGQVPSKVLKTTKPTTSSSIKDARSGKAEQRLARTGSLDDAASAMMARWAK